MSYLSKLRILYLPLKGPQVDGDDRIFREIHCIEMLFVYISNIVVYGFVMRDVLNGDPCEKEPDFIDRPVY